MGILKLDRAKERIAHPYTEDELMPLLLFRGNWEMGKAQALYKTALLMMDAEIPSIARIRDTTAQAHDLLHMTGMHEYAKGGLDMRPTFRRIYSCPTVLALNPRLKEYIEWLSVGSGFMAALMLYQLAPIDRWSVDSKRKWRYPYKRDGHRGGLKEPAPPKEKDSGIVVPEFYPFYADAPLEEYELLTWAHNLVPKSIPDHWRQDICQDLIVALLTGEITKGNADTAVRKYVGKVFKQYPSKYGPLSLDQAFSSSDDRTLLDTLASG